MQETEQSCQKESRSVLNELERAETASAETERDGLLDLDLEGIDRKTGVCVRREREEAAQGEKHAGKRRYSEYQGADLAKESRRSRARSEIDWSKSGRSLWKAKGALEEQQEVLQWDAACKRQSEASETDHEAGQAEEIGREP